MRRIPASLNAQFNALLVKNKIPQRYQIHYPKLYTSNAEKGKFIFNIGLLYVTNVFKSFTQKVKLILIYFFGI